MVRECLRVGWIDGQARGVDERRSAIRLTPRRPGSGWARTNKQRVAELTEAGLMLPRGRAVVDEARATGAWSLLDDVEALVEPADLAAALDAVPEARGTGTGSRARRGGPRSSGSPAPSDRRPGRSAWPRSSTAARSERRGTVRPADARSDGGT